MEIEQKIENLKPYDRVKVQFKGNNGRGGKTCNTGYVSFDRSYNGYAYFDCDNGHDKYVIQINKIIRIDN